VLALTLLTQTANAAQADPTSGAPAVPTTRLPVAQDIPTPPRDAVVAASTVQTNLTAGLITFGDSICNYTGASSNATAFVTLLYNLLGGTLNNRCVSGQWIQDEPTQLYVGGPAQLTPSYNAINIEQGGKNDATACNANANCNANSQLALQTILGWRSTSNIVLPSSAVETGAWANDAAISSCRATTTNGATVSYPITTYGSSAIGVTVRAYDGNGGIGGIKIDGGTQTAFPTSGVGGASIMGGARPSVFTYLYPVAAGTHSVVITNISATGASNLLAVCGVISGNSPTSATLVASPRIWSMEVIPYQNNQNPTWVSTINAMKEATVTQMAAYGFHVIWAPIRVPFAGAFNAANYISNQPTIHDPDGLACTGSTSDSVHPNDCGHKAIAQALLLDIEPTKRGAATTDAATSLTIQSGK
jgi:hypothetical protein